MDAARGVTNMFLAHEIAVSYFFIFIAKKHFSEFFSLEFIAFSH